MLKLTYEHPDFPPDYEFYFNGIGVVPNGGSVEISEEQEKAFIGFYGMTVSDSFKGSENATLDGSGVIADVSDVMPDEISDRPSPDPTAMNLVDGEPFEHANLSGAVTEPDPGELEPVAEEESTAPTTTVEQPQNMAAPTVDNGGDN